MDIIQWDQNFETGLVVSTVIQVSKSTRNYTGI